MRIFFLQHVVVAFWLMLASVSTLVVLGAAATSAPHEIPKNDCQFTSYPLLCVQALTRLDNSGSARRSDVISVLVNMTLQESKISPTTSDRLSGQEFQSVPEDCKELMSLASKRLEQTLTALKTWGARNKVQDIQTWLSAALTFQQACKDSADTRNQPYISNRMSYLTKLSSNALSLANLINHNNSNINNNNNGNSNKNNGHENDHFAPKSRRMTEQDRFPEWVSTRDRKILESSTEVEADAVVAQDGSGDYKTVSEAIKAASGGRFVIYVKSGVYKEKIKISKDGISLVGDGKDSTIITGDDSVADGSSMPSSATVTITGDGFIGRDIGFRNTAGPQGKQALALNIASDHSALYRCSLAGYQDTLYALALRQFYRECDIYGTIDFIFGNAAAVFQNCNLVLRRPRGGGYNVILASGRSDSGQNTGFSVQNCKITASSELSSAKHSVESYLGRPWKPYSRAVVMQSSIDGTIAPRGWVEWPGYSSRVLSSLYFAEYDNVGPGAGTDKRVKWPGFSVIDSDEAGRFTVANFISGNSWLPSTKVIYDSGL